MLDDRANRFLKFLRQVPRGLQVNDVVIGKLFALYLARVGDSRARGVGIHCCFLVRIFAIAQIGNLAERKTKLVRKPFRRFQGETSISADAFERRSNGRIVGRSCGKGLLR